MTPIKAAFACWDERIAPVFDTAAWIHVVEAGSGRLIAEAREGLPEEPSVHKALRLAELGIGELICGAISRPLHGMIASYGIRVIPFVAGGLNEIVQAWLEGALKSGAFAMPGCCGRGLRRGRVGFNKEVEMNGKGRDGAGRGLGQGRGRGGQGRGAMGGPAAAGAVGTCLCPKCGQTVPHKRGLPCVERICPKCGTAMIRQ